MVRLKDWSDSVREEFGVLIVGEEMDVKELWMKG
jgi:hypothetical protein